VEHSILMEGACVTGVERLEDSLIGRNSRISRNGRRGSVRTNVGDYSEVDV
jgi:glucose-1-phosphate thymidylyltransferase